MSGSRTVAGNCKATSGQVIATVGQTTLLSSSHEPIPASGNQDFAREIKQRATGHTSGESAIPHNPAVGRWPKIVPSLAANSGVFKENDEKSSTIRLERAPAAHRFKSPPAGPRNGGAVSSRRRAQKPRVGIGALRDWHDVVGDPPKVRVILAHLLANAIASTATGRVQLTVKPPDGEHWSIVVEDTGCGMTPEETARFFGDARSASASDYSPDEDSGLRTVRILVEQMQGKVLARSTPGQGTRIEIRLPVMIREPATPAIQPSILWKTSQAHGDRCGELESMSVPLRLLVVEDHDDLCATLRTFAETLGHQARVVGDMASALRVADEEPFDVLLSDIALPDGDGWELLGRLEQTGRRPRYAIAMSGFYGPAGSARSREAGFAVHLVKPFPPANLEKALEAAGHVVAEAGNLSGGN